MERINVHNIRIVCQCVSQCPHTHVHPPVAQLLLAVRQQHHAPNSQLPEQAADNTVHQGCLHDSVHPHLVVCGACSIAHEHCPVPVEQQTENKIEDSPSAWDGSDHMTQTRSSLQTG